MGLDARRISRVSRSRQQAKENYDRLSRWYDRLAGRSERRLRALGLERLAASEGEAVLEVGFGTGDALIALAGAVGQTGRVCGIDLSPGMVRVARSKLAAAGFSARVDLRVGDAIALPFAARSFDAVFMSFTLELFDTPEIPLVLRQCARVLHPGGRLAVVAMSKGGGLAEQLYQCLHHWFPVLIDCRPIYARDAIEAAGLQVSTVDNARVWGLPVEIVVARIPLDGRPGTTSRSSR